MNVSSDAISACRAMKAIVFAITATVVLTMITVTAHAESWQPGEGRPGVTGDLPVWAMTAWDEDGAGPKRELLVAAGGFIGAGNVATFGMAAWDGEAWRTLGNTDAPGADNQVFAVTVFEGDLIAGGDFASIDGVAASRIARWNGKSWHAIGTGFTGSVRSLAVYDGVLYAGGLQLTAGGTPMNGLARWTGATWQTVQGSLGNGAATAMIVHDGRLTVGGSFTSAGAVTTRNIAQWDGSQWHAMDGGVQNFGGVNALTSYQGDVIAAANFFGGSGQFLRSVARWNGTTWIGLNEGVNDTPSDTVNALAVFDGELYAGGIFTSAGGSSTPARMARWSGENWSPLPNGPGAPARKVHSMALYQGELIAGGVSTRPSGLQTSEIGRWTGTAWQYMGGGVNGVVAAVTSFQGDIYIGGGFTHAGTIVASSIARRSANGVWHNMNGGVSGGDAFVRSMVAYDGSLIISGSFTAVGGVAVPGIARWDGSNWHAFGTQVAGALFLHNSELYGVIASIHTSSNQPAKWDPVLQGWIALGEYPPNTVARCFTVYNGDLVAGGLGHSGSPAAVLRWDGSAWQPMGGTFGFNAIEALAVFDGELIAGGLYDPSTGGLPGGIARWNAATQSWQTLGGGLFEEDPEDFRWGVMDLLVVDDELIVAGVFSHAQTPFGVAVHNIARWNGTSWLPLGAGVSDQVLDLEPHGSDVGGVIVGGWFLAAGGAPNGAWARWGAVVGPVADLNGDGVVNAADLGILLGSWGTPGCGGATPCAADINGDGAVNAADLGILLGNWG